MVRGRINPTGVREAPELDEGMKVGKYGIITALHLIFFLQFLLASACLLCATAPTSVWSVLKERVGDSREGIFLYTCEWAVNRSKYSSVLMSSHHPSLTVSLADVPCFHCIPRANAEFQPRVHEISMPTA